MKPPFEKSNLAKHIIVLLLLVGIPSPIVGQSVINDDTEQCEPTMADECFTDVAQDLRCLGNWKRVQPKCGDLCKSIDDALQCASDVIDTDCGQKDGRDRFDAWLKGLRAVHLSLCSGDRTAMLAMTQNTDCWSPLSFVNCIEKSAGIDHVNDLLRLNLDMNECNRLMISIATCNVKATSLASSRCSPSLEGVNEIIHTFFSKTECGRVCGSGADTLTSVASWIIISCGILLKKLFL